MPKSETFPTPFDVLDIPLITRVDYDCLELRITAEFHGLETPVSVVFQAPEGFRVINEKHLNEFWEPSTRPRGWLWVVSAGGWFDQERQREGYCPWGMPPETREYLILGVDECVSILCTQPPVVAVEEA